MKYEPQLITRLNAKICHLQDMESILNISLNMGITTDFTLKKIKMQFANEGHKVSDYKLSVLYALYKKHSYKGRDAVKEIKEELKAAKLEVAEFSKIVALYIKDKSLSLSKAEMQRNIAKTFGIKTRYYLDQVLMAVKNSREIKEEKSVSPSSADGQIVLQRLLVAFKDSDKCDVTLPRITSEINALGYKVSMYSSRIFLQLIHQGKKPLLPQSFTLSQVEIEFIASVTNSFKVQRSRSLTVILKAMIYLMATGVVNPTELFLISKNMSDDDAVRIMNMLNQIDMSKI